MSFIDQITPLKEAALQALQAADSLAKLDDVRVLYLGTNGQFTGLLKQMGSLTKEERPAIGKAVNLAKAELTQTLDRRRKELELADAAPQRAIDFTAPGRRRPLGRQHPLTQVTEDIVRSFRKIGFAVADGPEIESERYCFDALNTPADHPARDTQDTFFLDTADRPLLRTHTSSVQIRVMKRPRRRFESSCRAACTAETPPTPHTTQPSTRLRAYMWTKTSPSATSRVR